MEGADVRAGRVPAVWLHSILVVLLLWDASAMAVHLVRVGFSDQIGHVEKLLNGLVLVGTALPVLLYAHFARGMTLFFLALFAHGVVMGLVRDHAVARPYVGQVYHWAVMTGGFTLGYATRLDARRLERIFTVMSYVILGASVLGFFGLERFRLGTGASLYVGYPSSQLVLPFAVFALRRAWLPAAASLWLLLAAGKRGPLLAVFLAGVFILTMRRFKGSMAALAIVAVLMAVTGWGLFAGMRTVVEARLLSPDSVVMRVATKWTETFEFQDDLTKATSGRDVEVERAARLVPTPSTLFLGQGYGWSIDIDGEHQHYVHLSYMNYVVTYGALWTVAIVGMLAVRLRRLKMVALARPDERLPWLLLFFLATNLVIAATASVLAISMLFWTLLGVATRVTEMASRPAAVPQPHPPLPSRADLTAGPATP